MLKSLTRVLVLSGVVTLTTAMGSIEGTPGRSCWLPSQARHPTKLAVQANSDFAFDLYQQLAKENDGKNLFFSPYSVSGALAMTPKARAARRPIKWATRASFSRSGVARVWATTPS